MAWEGPETFPPFLRVPGSRSLKLVSLCPPPASVLVALIPTHSSVDVRFTALSADPTPNPLGPRDEFSRFAEDLQGLLGWGWGHLFM